MGLYRGFCGGMGAWGVFGGLVSLLLFVASFAALILLGIWIWRRLASSRPERVGPAVTAREILEARYARGELTREEFKRTTADLDRPQG